MLIKRLKIDKLAQDIKELKRRQNEQDVLINKAAACLVYMASLLKTLRKQNESEK